MLLCPANIVTISTMSQLSDDERLNIVKLFYETEHSDAKIGCRMFSLYDNRRCLSLFSKTIMNMVKRFEESGSVQNRNRGKIGHISCVDAATIGGVAAAVQHAEGNPSLKESVASFACLAPQPT